MQPQEIIWHTAWLLMHDPDFLRQNAHLNIQVFPRGSLRYLVGLSLRNWNTHHQPLSRPTVDLATTSQTSALRRAHITGAQARDAFDDIDSVFALDQQALPLGRQICREWLEQRTIQLAMAKADAAISQGDLVSAHVILTTGILRNDAVVETVSLSASSPDFMQTLTAIPGGAIPTGFPSLNNAWLGGTRKGELGMIVAPTGVGKSMAMCFMAAEAFWNSTSVLYLTYELTPDQIRERITLAILGKPKSQIGDTWAKELQWEANARKLSLPASRIDIRNDITTWPEVIGALESYKDDNGGYPDMLLLDSADDIAPLVDREATHQQLSDAFTFMRREIVLGKNICTWTTGQLNRQAVEQAYISLKFIGSAFAKAQRSHFVLGFAQTPQQKDDMSGPEMYLYVLKDSLYGTAGAKITVAADFGKGRDGFPGYRELSTSLS